MTDSSSASRPHGAVGRLLWLGVAGFFAVAVLESLFRYVIFPEYRTLQQSIFTRHPVIGFYNRPNVVLRRYSPMNYDVINRTNSLGFRGPEKDMKAELSGLWVVGDSMTFGAGVEDDETYVAQLRNYGYWAANLSTEGLGLENQVLAVRYFHSLGYTPRAVIVALTLNNRIADFSPYQDYFTRPLLPADSQAVSTTDKTAVAVLIDRVESLKELVPTTFLGLRSRLIKSSAIYGWLKVGIMGVPFLRKWRSPIPLANAWTHSR